MNINDIGRYIRWITMDRNFKWFVDIGLPTDDEHEEQILEAGEKYGLWHDTRWSSDVWGVRLYGPKKACEAALPEILELTGHASVERNY